MQNLHIVRNVDIEDTFRVSRVMADKDIKKEHLNRLFEGVLDIPQKWQIGLICGASGTGKSTIAKDIFSTWGGQ